MEKISIVALRREKNKELETAALLRARQRTALQESLRAIDRPFHSDSDTVLQRRSERKDIHPGSGQSVVRQKQEHMATQKKSYPLPDDEFTFDVNLEPDQIKMIVEGLQKDNPGHNGAFFSDNGNGTSTQKQVIFRFNVKQIMPGRIITTREACRILRISTRTIYRYIRSGCLTAYKLGAELRFKEKDVYQFLLENKL